MNYRESLKKRIYSGDNLVTLSDLRYLPRWIVLMIDIILIIFATKFSSYIIEQLNYNMQVFYSTIPMYLMIIGVNLVYMYIFKTFAGIIRHSTFIDLFKLLLATFFSTLTVVSISYIYYILVGFKLISTHLPFLMIFFASSFMVLFIFRLAVKEFFHFLREFRCSSLKKRILVLGVDETSVAFAHAILDSPNLPYQVVGFLTDRFDSHYANLLGKPIYVREKLQANDKDNLALDGVLIAKENLSKEEMDSWVNLFLEKDLQIFKGPSLRKLQDNDLAGSIRTLEIEDFLNRKPIKMEIEGVRERHHQKTILITGGAGSIGSEIVRQVSQFNPRLIVVLDQAETPMYELELETREKYPHINFKFILGDISSHERLEAIFQKYQFSMVYHAAAYKHVPLIEENPHEAVLVNIAGSKNLATLSSKYKVNRFVMISTDKAVKPTNVMGASKRVAELFVQSLQNCEGNSTKFITTRFGNVLGSNGSVIPNFKRQIEAGGPLTITHPDIVRHFMTISEACELVLQAGTMGKGGEIFVFDMGDPVKILDLAERMIKLSGFEPNIDIKIIYTGLRPGEKLYEELLSDDATTIPTHHEKIMISKDPIMDFEEIEQLVKHIVEVALSSEKIKVVKLLKGIVQDFKSNNSIYEVLDK
jgi:FlaA1/EpsC-like NDP-sugar epimerase